MRGALHDEGRRDRLAHARGWIGPFITGPLLLLVMVRGGANVVRSRLGYRARVAYSMQC